jgi:uncharacterized protein YndB with AHSA1/START domain
VSHDLTLERLLDVTPEIAFDAFVDPDAQKELYADAPDWVVESECDLRVGGRWTISFGAPGAKPAVERNVFEEIERPRRVSFRSTMESPDGSRLDTVITVTFEQESGKTRMRLVQRGFPTAELRDGYENGWASILDGLERAARARRTTFVLIPGAWLGGWIWEPVASSLRARGYRVRPVTLSGLDGTADDVSEIGLSAHVQDVLAIVEGEDMRDVIVVGHLYSGLVAGQVADRVPERVSQTVFVESFLPRDGRAMVDALTEEGRKAELRAVEQNEGLWPPPTPAEVADGNGLSPEDSRRLAESFVPHPGRTIAEPARLARPLAEQRATYIASSMGAHSTLADVIAMRDEPNWRFRTIETGHWPMASAPDELAELLAEAAERSG